MQITIISDTHTNSINSLPAEAVDDIKFSDITIHAGDFDSYRLYSQLAEISQKLVCVRGNMDTDDQFSEIPEQLDINLEGISIGISHGTGSPDNILNRLMYKHQNARLIIFGHIHKPLYKNISGVDFLNPGSLSYNRGLSYVSHAVMMLKNSKYTVRIKNTEV